jgi:hypothetical protein
MVIWFTPRPPRQDELAEAFTDGYRFELTDVSTVATRFQR